MTALLDRRSLLLGAAATAVGAIAPPAFVLGIDPALGPDRTVVALIDRTLKAEALRYFDLEAHLRRQYGPDRPFLP